MGDYPRGMVESVVSVRRKLESFRYSVWPLTGICVGLYSYLEKPKRGLPGKEEALAKSVLVSYLLRLA